MFLTLYRPKTKEFLVYILGSLTRSSVICLQGNEILMRLVIYTSANKRNEQQTTLLELLMLQNLNKR